MTIRFFHETKGDTLYRQPKDQVDTYILLKKKKKKKKDKKYVDTYIKIQV